MAILQSLTATQLDKALDAGLSEETPLAQLCSELENLLKPSISKREALDRMYSRRRLIGTKHANADALSGRYDESTTEATATPDVTVNAVHMSEPTRYHWTVAQSTDPDTAILYNHQRAGRHRPTDEDLRGSSEVAHLLRNHWPNLFIDNDLLLIKETANSTPRVVVPGSLIIPVLTELGHVGQAKTENAARQRFWWPQLRETVATFCNSCPVCASFKSPQQRFRAPLQPMVTGFPFQRVGVHIIGPLAYSTSGHEYILVMVDYFTKWAEAIPLRRQDALSVTTVFFNDWICRFGAPLSLHSDCGANFESKLIQDVCDQLHNHKTRTTPAHPEGNGQVERTNRTLINLLKAFAEHHRPFNWDTRLPKGPLELTGEALTAFERIKNSLADATLLTHPAPEAQLSLMVDASTVAVGAVLQQHLAGSTQPLAFFSKKLLPAETRYSTFGRELLAIYLAVKHFRHFLEGQEFTIFTDHKPLTFSIHSRSDKLSPREIRHLDYISQFTSDIRHIDGSRNEVADELSRPSIAHLQLSPGIDLAEMAAEQRRVGSPCDEDASGLQLQELPLKTGNGTILCDVSTPSHRPFVPPSLRRKVFSSLHNLSHPGSRATDKLVSDRFVWPAMHKDLKAWTRACIPCQRSKIQRHNKAPIDTLPGPGARFSHVHLDIVGPLPLSNGCSYLLTCVDRFTRRPEAIPLPDIAAPTVVKAFLSRWVAIFGAPSTITTDRGDRFESHLFQSLLSFLGCTRSRTTAYHPAANGMVERFHRQLKASLRAAADPKNWTDHLPLVLLGIRSALKPDLDCSAAELVFGATVRLPGEMITPTQQGAVEDPTNLLHRLRQFMRTLSPVPPRSSASPSYLEKDLATCSHVYLRCDRVRRPLEPPYDGPFRVISRGTKNFRIQRGTREEVVSVDRLKAAVPDTPPDEPCGPLPPAPPPRPSIPPSRILPLPPCPPPTTATTPSSTNNTTPPTPSAPLRATFGLAGGYCGSLRLLALCICHAAFLSASHSLSIRCWDARGLSLASRVLEANQRSPLSDWLADAETTEAGEGSEHTAASSTHFLGKVRGVTIAPDEIMVSFDVVSLFTSIPKEVAMRVISDLLERR
ncbi:hypothetical protein SprV_0301151900 [Sparganum proliferum]